VRAGGCSGLREESGARGVVVAGAFGVPRWDAARRVTSPPVLARGRYWGRGGTESTTIILPGAAEQRRACVRVCGCKSPSLQVVVRVSENRSA
jgi:hypothetical protein